MNLRINGQELRFRISKAQLELLCKGNDLEQSTFLPVGQVIKICITPKYKKRGMSLSNISDCIMLCVNKEDANIFLKSLPNRQGLETVQKIDNDNYLKLVLEVDVRTQWRKNSLEIKR